MKKGINIWCFRDQCDVRGCMTLSKRAGFEGIELAYAEDGAVNPRSTGADMSSLARLARGVGIELTSLASGITWKYNLISDAASERDAAMAHVRKALELAGALCVDTLLLVPGFIGPFMAGASVVRDYEEAYRRGQALIHELAEHAQHQGVCIGVENVWNKFLSSAIEMRDFVDGIGHPCAQCYFDVGNVLRTGYPEHWIRVLGKRIKKVHFKDFRANVGALDGFVELLQGDVDYPAVMAALRQVGYDDWCVAELGPRRDWPESMLEPTSRAMDLILGRG